MDNNPIWLNDVLGDVANGKDKPKPKQKKENGNSNVPKSNKPTLEDLKKGPPKHPDFKSPKGGDRKVKNPNGKGTGWVDKDGDVWVPTDHNGTHAPHWDRQHPGGKHTNVYPVLKAPSAEAIKNTGIIVVAGVVTYEIVKWSAAIILAPETLGGSLVVAGATP
jgi:hypothetical protein